MSTMHKAGLIFLLSLSLPLYGFTQGNEREALYKSYIKGDMPSWRTLIDNMHRNTTGNTFEDEMILLEAYYGYIPWCIGTGRKEEARHDLEQAMKLLDALLIKEPDHPVLWAGKGAFLGYKIVLGKIPNVFLWPQSKTSLEKAIQLDPVNPAGWCNLGNAMYYLPPLLGGSRTKAIDYYKKAIELWEKHPATLTDNWIYLNTLAQLGIACSATGKPEAALVIYEKILSREPRFDWVKNHLLPETKVQNHPD